MSKKKEEQAASAQKADIQMDATEARRKRCEPIVQNLLKEMLKSEVLYADQAYIRQRCMVYLEAMFKEVLLDTFNMTLEMMELSLAKSLDEASCKLWAKDLDDIGLQDIDDKLKGK